jgi:hypothetical protein
MTPIRHLALREPLVDVVESHSVVTNSAKLKVSEGGKVFLHIWGLLHLEDL